jgi:hypothetical protein
MAFDRNDDRCIERLLGLKRTTLVSYLAPIRSVAAVFLSLAGVPAQADELASTHAADSPDGRKRLEANVWDANGMTRIDIVLSASADRLWEFSFPPEIEARYAKLSWSPSSEAALVSANYKCGEDWVLIQFENERAYSTYFSGGERVTRKMLETLPFRDEIKNSAPVGRIPWKTVRWLASKQCEMTFIYRGIGYEGTAHLRIDFQRNEPTITITSIVPTIDAKLWNDQ